MRGRSARKHEALKGAALSWQGLSRASPLRESGDNQGMHQHSPSQQSGSRKLTDFSVFLTVLFWGVEKFVVASSTYKKVDTVARYVERMLSSESNKK